MKAVILTPVTLEIREITNLHDEIGGYLECLGVGEDFTCFIDEDGKAKQLPVNLGATEIIQRMLDKRGRTLLPGDVIVGTAIFVGFGTEDVTDLPQHVIDEYFQAIDAGRTERLDQTQ